MNALKPISWIGMPWHGLATNGVLTIIGGTKTINGDFGCVAVRHPSAPGASGRTPAQQAVDAAMGYAWRDYALLCGTQRNINGGPSLGGTAWLYCAPDGRTWRMTANVSIASDVVTIEVWRRELFGVFGREYTITDELVGSLPVTVDLPAGYTGSVTAAQVAAQCSIPYAACLQVNPAGNSVHVHVLIDKDNLATPDMYDGTFCYFHGVERSLYCITTATITGSGDPSAGGVGISAAFSNTEEYADLSLNDSESVTYELGTDITLWDKSTFVPETFVGTPSQEGIPCVIGNTHEGFEECQEDYPGHLWERVTGNADERHGKVLRTHHGDLITRYARNALIFNKNWIINGTIERRFQYEAQDDGQGGCQWVLVGSTTINNAEARDITNQVFGNGAGNWDFNNGQFAGGESYDFTEAYTESGRSLTDCAEQWAYDGNGNINNPAEINFTGGAFTGGMTIAQLELTSTVSIYPGVLVASHSHRKPDNSGTWVFSTSYIGIGEGSAAVMEVNAFEDPSQSPPLSKIVTGWAFQPVDMAWTSAKGTPVQTFMYC